jgi:hypothetical protein
MKIRNLPSEYAVAFVAALAFLAAAIIVVGTKKLNSDLSEIDESMEKRKIEVEKTSMP